MKKRIREISFKAVIVLCLFIVSIFLFAFLAHEIVFQKQDLFDTKVFNYLKPLSSAGFIQLMKTLTFFGSSYFLLPAYIVIVVWLLWKRKKEDAINVTVIALSSTVLKTILKTLFQRKRPELPLFETLHNYSFPSGHALSSVIFCSVIIFLIWKGNSGAGWKWLFSVLLILFAFSIGLSRVVLRYHYASDVMAGFCLGFVLVILSFWIQQKISKKVQAQPA